MTPSSYFFSASTKSLKPIITPQSFLLHSISHLPKLHSLLSLKPLPSISILKTTSKLTHPFASISSFAESGNESEHEEPIKVIILKKAEEEEQGMAQAFHISSSTSSAITICIAIAALSFPLFMASLGQGLGLKTKIASYATLLLGFYMAWNIGANDVANAMGTSVGSGALTLRQAVVLAAVLEFSGALLLGRDVTSTMQKGILVSNVFHGKDNLLFAGLVSSLAAAGTWLQVQILGPLFSLVVYML